MPTLGPCECHVVHAEPGCYLRPLATPRSPSTSSLQIICGTPVYLHNMIQAFLLYLCLASGALANNVRSEPVPGPNTAMRMEIVPAEQSQAGKVAPKTVPSFATTATQRGSPYPQLSSRQIREGRKQREAEVQSLKQRREEAIASQREMAEISAIINNPGLPEAEELRRSMARLSLEREPADSLPSKLEEKVRLFNVPTNEGPINCIVYSESNHPTLSALDLAKVCLPSSTTPSGAACRGSPLGLPRSVIPTIRRGGSRLQPRRGRFRLGSPQ